MPGDCTCDIYVSDRGWFNRFHNYCKNKQSENKSQDDCPPESDAFKFIISIAVVCGLSWMIAGVFSIAGCDREKDVSKRYALVSTSIYLVSYIIFAGLFGVVMTQINYRNLKFDELEHCDNVKKQFRKSGNVFLGFSICEFVLIWISIVCTLCSLGTK